MVLPLIMAAGMAISAAGSAIKAANAAKHGADKGAREKLRNKGYGTTGYGQQFQEDVDKSAQQQYDAARFAAMDLASRGGTASSKASARMAAQQATPEMMNTAQTNAWGNAASKQNVLNNRQNEQADQDVATRDRTNAPIQEIGDRVIKTGSDYASTGALSDKRAKILEGELSKVKAERDALKTSASSSDPHVWLRNRFGMAPPAGGSSQSGGAIEDTVVPYDTPTAKASPIPSGSPRSYYKPRNVGSSNGLESDPFGPARAYGIEIPEVPQNAPPETPVYMPKADAGGPVRQGTPGAYTADQLGFLPPGYTMPPSPMPGQATPDDLNPGAPPTQMPDADPQEVYSDARMKNVAQKVRRSGMSSDAAADFIYSQAAKAKAEKEALPQRAATADVLDEIQGPGRGLPTYMQDEQGQYPQAQTRPQPQEAATADILRRIQGVGGERPDLSGSLYSDKRSKSVGKKSDALDMAEKTPGSFYTYKSGVGEDPSKQHFGPMAQDLEKSPVGKTVVSTGPDGLKRVDTKRLTMVNTAGIHDLVKRLNKLEGSK